MDVVQHLNRLNQVNVSDSGKRPYLTVLVEGRHLTMELDSGAPCGIISVKTLRTVKPHYSLYKSDRQFVSYTHHPLQCIGRIPVNVTLGNTTRRLNLYVVDGDYDILFGRE